MDAYGVKAFQVSELQRLPFRVVMDQTEVKDAYRLHADLGLPHQDRPPLPASDGPFDLHRPSGATRVAPGVAKRTRRDCRDRRSGKAIGELA